MSIVRKVKRNASEYGKKPDFVQVSYFNFSEGAHVMWRKKRYRESTPKQKNLNLKHSKRFLEALIEANFKGHRDYHVTLTFDKEHYPADEKDARRLVKNWIARINYRRKRKNLDKVKYIIVLEVSKTGRFHFHIIMDGALDRDTVESLWECGYCNCDRLKADPVEGLGAIIRYISKDSKGAKRWIPSTGLIKPWVSPNKTTKISNKRWKLMKELPIDSEVMVTTIMRDNPGYYPLSIEKDYNDETGAWYIYVRLRSMESINNAGQKIISRSGFDNMLGIENNIWKGGND